jgi:hypothetical protein
MKSKLSLIALGLLLAASAHAATCPAGTTHIVDTLLLADGATPMRGTIAVRGPSAPAGSTVAGTTTVTIATGGVVDFCLTGGPGWKYDATFSLKDANDRPTDQFTERWIVPATAAVLTRARLWGGSSAPQFLVSPQQLNPAGLNAGQGWIWDGSSWVPGSGGTSIAGAPSTWPSTFAPSSHASSHASGQADAITPAAIGALPANNPVVTGTLSIMNTFLEADITTPTPDATKTQLYAKGGKWCAQSTGGSETCTGGAVTMTTGSADPVASCTAPSASNLALYTQTTSQDIWACVATNIWKKVLSTTNTGTYAATGLTGTAPSNPASGSVTCYYSSVSNTQICLDSSGNAFTMVKADAGSANNFLTAISAAGVISKARPTCSSLSDAGSGCSASAYTLPNPGASTLGGVKSITCSSGHISQIGTDGLPVCSADSTTGGSVTVATKGDLQTFTTAAANLTVGSNGTHLEADSTAASGLKWVAGGTLTIAAGTAALGTSAIGANACASVVTPTASTGTLTGTATTDTISWTPSADISAVTGYGAASTDGLIIYPYPTTDHVNFKVCNATGSSITPGAVTLNWAVRR